MRNPERLDNFYEVLKETHKKYFPDWRYFQFTYNFMNWIYSEHGIDPFFAEEDKALELIKEFVNEV